uniref:NACHT domain-containing protein n=1 Tax=Strigamia maritima TaxID=126957 RepID=T1IL94_STRMM
MQNTSGPRIFKVDKEGNINFSVPNHETRSCCETIDNNSLNQCDDFKRKLQQYNRSIVLPKPAWLSNEGSELSFDEHFIDLQLNDANNSIRIEDVFNSLTNSRRPIRILIEGQPGFGKTTLALKLASDWALNKTYINFFKLAFFVPLRELQQQSIKSVIDEIGKRCGCNDAVRIVNQHKKNTLFILDGLDEVSLDGRLEIMKLLYKQYYSDATVVAFSRTGIFEISKDEAALLFSSTMRHRNFHDKHISVLGFNEEDKKTFLLKFMPEANVDVVIKRLASQFTLFKSPLLLMLIPIILEDDQSIEHFSSITELYKKLFNCIIKNSCAKRRLHVDQCFDLFRITSSVTSLQNLLREFGMLSVRKILENEVQFESNDVTGEIYQLGFLTSHKRVTFVHSITYYQAVHLSILEFSAAFTFWLDLKLKKFKSEELLTSVVNLFFKSEGTSLILPFLAGLMEDDLDNLLSRIKQFGVWFSLDFELTMKLLSECSSINIAKSNFLANFIPSRINIRYCEDSNEMILK